MANFKWIYTKKDVEKRVKELSKKLQQELTDQGHVATGALKGSVTPGTKFTKGRNIKSTIKAFARGEKLDKRQYGEFVKVSDILRWMTVKETSPQGNRFSYRETKGARRSVAFAIKTELEKKGPALTYKGKTRTGWITNPYNKFKQDIDHKLEKPIAQDFERLIDRVLEELAAKDKNIIYLK